MISFTIAPWNAPIVLSVRALAIPLFCGNGVVFKPSENSPRSQSIVVDALHEVRAYFLSLSTCLHSWSARPVHTFVFSVP